MLHLKTTTMTIIVRTLRMLKKETDKHIKKIPSSPSSNEIQQKLLYRNCLSL